MIEPYYFEIPIYRCDIDTHTNEMALKEKKYIRPEFKEIAPESYQNFINYYHRSIWYPWKYNEVIGWLCLYIMGSQIRADYYFVSSIRIGKGIRKKKFMLYGKAFEHYLPHNATSQEIFNELITEIENLNKEKGPFKGRYIDTKTLKTIGPFVDWKLLSDRLNSFRE